MRTRFLLAALAGAAGASAALGAPFIMVPDSNTDQVMLVNGVTGEVLQNNYLDIATQAAAAGVTSTPIEALEIGNEVWVSDQNADRIWRFDRDTRAFLGDVGAGGDLNNIRGMERVGNTLYVAQGSASDNFGEGIITIDITTQTVTGLFASAPDSDISYWDVLDYNGELLVTNSDTGNDGIERFMYDGSFIADFASSDGVSDFDFMQQLAERESNGNLIGGGFSLPSGVYEFMPDGTALGTVAGQDFGPRGVYELPSGDVMWTNGANIRTDTEFFADGGSYRFISPLSVPAPGAAWGLAVFGVAAARRRR